MANMRDVANRANVSVSTVSAYLNGTKFVSPKLAQRIRGAIEQVGYDADKGQIKTPEELCEVAVILPGIYSSFFAPLLTGMTDAASEFDMNILLFDSSHIWKRENVFIERLAKRGTKNLILDSVCNLKHEAEYFTEIRRQLIEKHGICVVVLEREVKDNAFHSIYLDNFEAAYKATEHLISMGHKRIVHIKGPKLFPHSSIRADGYRQALHDYGIRADERLVLQGDYSPISGFAAISEFYAKGLDCTAVFSGNDQMAIGAIKAIRQQGLSVPEDVAMVGFDNLIVSSLISPGLSTVKYPIYQMGYLAVQTIAKTRQGVECPLRTKLNAQLIIRRSSDASQQEDWNLQKW